MNTDTTPVTKNPRTMPAIIIFFVVITAVIIYLGIVLANTLNAKTPATTTAKQPQRQPATTAANTVVYTDPQKGFKLMLPADWKQFQQLPSGVLAAFTSTHTDPNTNGNPSYAPNINVTAAPAGNTTLEAYVNNALAAQPTSLAQYKNLGVSDATVAGLPAKLMSSSLLLDSKYPVTNYQLAVIKSGTVYVITGTSLTSTWSQHRDMIKAALLSFQP